MATAGVMINGHELSDFQVEVLNAAVGTLTIELLKMSLSSVTKRGEDYIDALRRINRLLSGEV